jgi:hypothetical protein
MARGVVHMFQKVVVLLCLLGVFFRVLATCTFSNSSHRRR